MQEYLLGLSEFKMIEAIQENENDILIGVEKISKPIHCPHCRRKAKFYKHGSREQVILDVPMRLKRVSLQVNRKRYKCLECGSTFWERLLSVDENHSMTKRLLQFIEEQSMSKRFVEIAEYVGIDEKTVRNIYKNYVAFKERQC